MRKATYPAAFIVALLTFCNLSAQESAFEIGIHLGATSYSGDLSPREFGFFIADATVAGGAYVRYRPAGRIGLRLMGSFGRVSAERERVLPNEDGLQIQFDQNFRSSIAELTATLEVDLIKVGDSYGDYGALYAFGGAGIFTFEPEAQIDGIYYKLQPLATEGQGIQNSDNYDPAPYELTRPVYVLGLGIRTRFNSRVVLGFEMGGRITGTDYLDDVSNTTVNYLDVLENSNSLGAQFSNPTVRDVTQVPADLTYRRGGEFNDYYYIATFTLGVTIGRNGGRAGDGCFKF